MGRHLKHEDPEFEDYNPSCMWGILQILDYHHWRRKHGRGKHALCFRNPKTVSFDRYNGEVQEYLDAEAAPLPVKQQTRKTSPADRKAQIKAKIAEERSTRSHLDLTASIHNLEPPDDGLGKLNADWANPIIILHKSASLPTASNAEGYSKQSQLSDAKQLNREISGRQFKDNIDVLEIFRENKKLFLHILQDPDAQAANNFHGQHTSNSKARLKKSGSFPAANLSHVRLMEPATLEHKQKEIWSFPKREKLHNEAQASSFVASNSLEDSNNDNSICLKDDDGGGVAITQQTSLYSPAFPQGLDRHGWHHSFMSHIKDIKKIIKHALKKNQNNNHTSMTAVLDKVPTGGNFSADEKDVSERLKEIPIHQDDTENPKSFRESNGSDNDHKNGGLPHVRRASSLNESVDRYTRLFEYSISRDGKWNQYQSKSLKLTNEDKFPSNGHNLKYVRRRLSLSDLESFVPLPNEASRDGLHSRKLGRSTVEDSYANTEIDSNDDLKSAIIPVEETELQDNTAESGNNSGDNKYSGGLMIGIEEGIAETGEIHEVMIEPYRPEHSFHQDQKLDSIINSRREHEEECLVSVLESRLQDDITGSTEFPVSKSPDSFVVSQDNSSRDSLAGFCSTREDVETANQMIKNHVHHCELNREEDTDFNYVRDVLELSGFTDPDYPFTWHSLDQPLSPTLFKELEAYLHHELECPSEDVGCNCNHQLLFDLINEELFKIYESSLAYFPKPFSCTQGIRPLPKGSRIVEETWKRIRWYRNSRLKQEQSLGDIVAEDLAKGDGWMNLHLDVEDVALDLEDMIFDELVDEIIMT